MYSSFTRWETLQEVLKSWEQYRNEEQRLNDWLYEKEKGLKDISLFDMGDKKEVQKQIQKLKVGSISLYPFVIFMNLFSMADLYIKFAAK